MRQSNTANRAFVSNILPEACFGNETPPYNPYQTMKKLLIVAHMPSPNTQAMADQVLAGARSTKIDTDSIEATLKSPFVADATDVLETDAIILSTTENLGYMSGALKDFFDRIYYPCLEKKQGMAYGLCIRAGHDGTGTQRAIASITTGLRWRLAQEVLLCRGEFREDFLSDCYQLGLALAASLEAGII